jgi:hypothetical protein
MTPELQEYYELRLRMMGDRPWYQLMEDVEEMLKATNDISSIQDEKTLHFRRGEISMMRWMLSLRDVSEQAYQQLKDEDAQTS